MSADSLIMLLKSFNLTTMAGIYDESIERAERENWGYRKFLSYLCENEYQDRHERKIKRLLSRSKLPEGKTLSSMDEKLLPAKCRKTFPSLIDGSFVERSEKNF